MILLGEFRFACQKCQVGHRAGTCNHLDRELIEVKPKGRPSTQCHHCKGKRHGTVTGAHSRCMCGLAKSSLHPKQTCQATFSSSNLVFTFSPADLDQVEKIKAIFTNLPENIFTFKVSKKQKDDEVIEEVQATFKSLDVVDQQDPDLAKALENPCMCQFGGECVCSALTKKSAGKKTEAATPPASCCSTGKGKSKSKKGCTSCGIACNGCSSGTCSCDSGCGCKGSSEPNILPSNLHQILQPSNLDQLLQSNQPVETQPLQNPPIHWGFNDAGTPFSLVSIPTHYTVSLPTQPNLGWPLQYDGNIANLAQPLIPFPSTIVSTPAADMTYYQQGLNNYLPYNPSPSFATPSFATPSFASSSFSNQSLENTQVNPAECETHDHGIVSPVHEEPSKAFFSESCSCGCHETAERCANCANRCAHKTLAPEANLKKLQCEAVGACGDDAITGHLE